MRTATIQFVILLLASGLLRCCEPAAQSTTTTTTVAPTTTKNFLKNNLRYGDLRGIRVNGTRQSKNTNGTTQGKQGRRNYFEQINVKREEEYVIIIV